jgi:hypothetical protein
MHRYWGKAAKDGAAHHLLVYHSLDVAATLHALLDASFGHHGKPPDRGSKILYLPDATIQAINAFLQKMATLFLPGVPRGRGDDSVKAVAAMAARDQRRVALRQAGRGEAPKG